MRIGINALYLIPGGVGGTEIYLRNLVAALARYQHDYFLFTNIETGSDLSAQGPNLHYHPQNVRAANRASRLVWEQTELPMQAHALRLDSMLNPGFTAPLARACPNVTVFHDLQHKRHPEYFRWFDLPAWNFFLWASARRSQVLIADSEVTKADLIRFYSIDSQRIHVIPLGVEEAFFDLENEPESFFLCASTLHPHKNLEGLILAFDEFRRAQPHYKLVITGVRGFHTDAITALVNRLKCSVELTGWLPRPQLLDLFRRAAAVFYPSTFEGFGLPVLEAMAAGVPLACSHIEPLNSMAAALFFDPHDIGQMTNAMERLASDSFLRSQLAAEGRERAKSFTWDACARKTLDAIEASLQAVP